MTVTSVTVRVPAKINLQLAVGPLRPDGYHGLVTVFHAVSLFDDVTAARAESDTVTVTGKDANLVPANADNLALRAVSALRDHTANHGGVSVTIKKRIPVAGGMAGGSADAAAALVACNELWDTGLSQAELCAIGSQVGSDVAFAVIGETAVGQGRGEQLTPVKTAAATYHWVLALADGHLSTPKVFQELDRQRQSKKMPDPALSAELMHALSAGDPARLGKSLTNDLQEPALTLFPALRKTLEAGIEAGALGALVSGSGPTCFFVTASASDATTLADALSAAGVCRSVATATGPAAGASVIAN
jgi:4-diphosphocytidyl-2-C-methyl-D-erythritol kinase